MSAKQAAVNKISQQDEFEFSHAALWNRVHKCSFGRVTVKGGMQVQGLCRCMKWMRLSRCLIKLKSMGGKKKLQCLPSAFLDGFWYFSLREVMPAGLMSKLCVKAKLMPVSSALVSETLTEQWQDLLCTNPNSNNSF